MTKEQIKDIAGNLECGFKCFVHRRTGDLKFFPHFDQYPDIDIDTWKDDIKLVKRNVDHYFQIENLDSRQSFNVMKNFVETIEDPTCSFAGRASIGRSDPLETLSM